MNCYSFCSCHGGRSFSPVRALFDDLKVSKLLDFSHLPQFAGANKAPNDRGKVNGRDVHVRDHLHRQAMACKDSDQSAGRRYGGSTCENCLRQLENDYGRDNGSTQIVVRKEDRDLFLSPSNALGRSYAGKTVLAVAHRLSTVAGFARIIVIDNGQITEDGTPWELRARGGAFDRMWRI